MTASLVRLGKFQRVVRSTTSCVNQRIPMSTTGAKEETPNLVHFWLGGREHDFKSATSAFPHGALPRVNVHHSAAIAQQRQGERG